MRQFYLLFLSITIAFFGFLFKNNDSGDSTAINYEKKVLATPKPNPPKKYRPLVLKREKILENETDKPVNLWVDNALLVPAVTATKTVAVNGGGNPIPGSQLDYTIVVNNSGTDATNVVVTDNLVSDLTLVAGSVKATPIGVDNSYNVTGNVGITVPAANGLLSNDISPDNSALTATAGTFTGIQGGTFVIAADGSFTYINAPGFTGTDTYTYTVNTANGKNSTAVVSAVVNNTVWFIDASYAGGGSNGTLAKPFTSINDFQAINDAANTNRGENGDIIYVYDGTYTTTAITLRNNQKLIGQSATGTFSSLTGIIPQTFTNALPTNNPSLTTSFSNTTATPITLGSANEVYGFTSISSTSGTTMSGASVGALKIRDVSLVASAGQALQITAGGALDVIFKSISSAGASKGISVNSCTGSFQVSGTGVTAGSGGTINNITARGAEFISCTNVTLKNMNFTSANTTNGGACDGTNGNSACNGAVYLRTVNGATLDRISISGTTAQMGVNVNDVTNLSVQNATIANCGNETYEGCIVANSLKGTCDITNSTLSVPFQRVVNVTNTGSETLTLNVAGSTLQDAPEDGLLFQITGTTATGNATLNVTNSNFLRNQNAGINAQNSGNSTMTFNLNGSTIDPQTLLGRGFDAVSFGNGSGRSTFNFNIGTTAANTIRGNGGIVANVLMQGKADGQGKIQNNLIQKVFSAAGLNAGAYIRAYSQEFSTLKVDITGNQCKPVNTSGVIITDLTTFGGSGATTQYGMDVGVAVGSATTIETARTDAYIHNNTVFVNSSGFQAINLTSGGSETAASTYINCSQVSGNTTTQQNVNARSFRLRNGQAASSIRLATSGSSGATPLDQMKYAWDNNTNTPISTTNANTVVTSGAGSFTLVGLNTCLTASNPPAPSAMEMFAMVESERNMRISQEENNIEEEKVDFENEEKNLLSQNNELQNTKFENSVAAPNSGETITVNGTGSGFSLPANKSTTITFSATVSATPSTCAITNVATVSGSNFSNVNSNTTTTNLIVPPPTAVTTATPICTGNSIGLVATCSSGTVQWYNAASTGTLLGTSASLGTFTQSPTGNTTYQAACKVGGCESVRVNSGLITVNALPVPNPSSNSPACSGKTLNLTSASSTSYLWVGPNSFSSTVQNPSISNVTIPAGGTYTITQTNSFGCTASATTSVTINQTPTATIGSNSPICSGNSLNLTSSGGGTYSWSGPNSFTSSVQNPSIASATTAATGTYIVTVTSSGCTATNSVVVTVNALPVPNPSSNSPVCSGNTLNLSSVAGMTNYSWTGPNSFTSSVQSPSISGVTTAASGTYTVTVTNSNGCTASATTAVTINQTPTPNIGSNSPVNITNTLNLTSGTASTYLWAGPNSFSSSVQNPSITNVTTAAAGTYTVTLTTSGCSTSATTAVVISETSANSNSPVCTGNSLNLSALGGGTYLWAGPNSFTSTSQNPSITNVTIAAGGTYTVTVTNGLSTATATTAVTINTTPIPNPSSDSPKCEGTTLTFNSAAGMTTYAWSGPNSFSSSIQAPSISSVTTAASGTYTLTVTNAGCSASATTAVTINAVATAIATPNTQTICSGETITTIAITGTGSSYTWTRDNTTSVTGIAASGSGDISGALTNTTEAPITVTFTITPVGTCNGTPITATVIVNPIPTATASTPSQSICSGASITGITFGVPPASVPVVFDPSSDIVRTAVSQTPQGIVFSSAVIGTVYNWTRDNVGTVTGIAASGTGNIAGILTNTTASPITVTFTVTPSYTNAGKTCDGTPITVTVTVNPNPTTPAITGGDAINCGGDVELSGPSDPNFTYLWQRHLFINSNIFTNLGSSQTQIATQSGIYKLTITNQYNCTGTVSKNVYLGDFVFNGSLGAGDATQTGRINRFTNISTCSNVTACPGLQTPTGARVYDSYTITNPRNTTICAKIGLKTTCGTNAFMVAYTGSFNPSAPCTNYLADPGSSFTDTFMEVNIPANGTIVVVVHEVNSNTGCGSYNLVVDLPRETAGITVTPNNPICAAGSPTTLTASVANSYLWTPGGATTSFINVTPNIATTYSVTLGYGNGSCSATATTEVTINPAPTASSNSPICAGATLNLSTGTATSYTWTGPNAFSSSLQNPSISNATTAAGGTYTVVLVNGSCTTTATTAVTVNPLVPNPSSNSPRCIGTTLTFNSVAGMTSYAWTGPNSFSSSIQAPSISNVTTAAGGTYTLTVTNSSGCSASATTAVTINALPVPNPSSDSPKCVGTTLAFNSVAGMTTYAWSGPNSFSSSIQNPSINNVTTAAGGTYTLTVTNSNSCSASATTAVTINALPVIQDLQTNAPICVTNTLELSVSGGTSYLWRGPNSFSSTSNAPTISNVTTANGGVYTVTVGNVAGCTASATINVVINSATAQTASSNSAVCAGNTLNLTSTGNPIFTYAWAGPNSFTSDQQNPSISSVTTSAAGTYTVTVTDNNRCTVTATTAVIINPQPVPNPSSDSPKCVGTTLTFNSVAGMTTYAWAGPNSFSSSIQAPSISSVTTASGGTYTLTVTNSNGCTASATTSVTINPLPVPNPSSDSPKCVGTTLTFNSVAGMTSYAWTGPNSFSSSIQTPSISSVSTAANGTYILTVTNSNGCSASATTAVTINALPVPNAGSNSPQCEGGTLNLTSNAGATTYAWTGPNSFTANTQNPSISNASVLASGIYSAVLTNSNNCSATGTVNVVINPKPVVSVATPPAICLNNSTTLTANCTVYTVSANLIGGEQVPPVTTTANGAVIGTYNSVTNQLNLAISFNGLTANATAGHIHSGAIGTNGGVLVGFMDVPNAKSGNITYTGDASSFASSLLAGNTYVNIHNGTYPSGEIRGQLSATCVSNTYSWMPGSLSGASVTVSPTITTTYTVTASNSTTGCSATATTEVVVNPLPVPTVGSNSPICSGTTLNLNAGGGATYAWTGPNSFSSSVQNPSIASATTANSGTYSVTITTALGCTATATVAATIFVLPNPTISSNSPVCAGTTLSFTAENGETAYAWTGPNSFSSSLQNPTIPNSVVANSGVYAITITNSNGCTATATISVTVNPLSVSATNTGPYITNQTIQLVGTGGSVYSWSGPNGFTAIGAIVNRPNATLNMAGVYTATITNGPCSNTATTNVVITGVDPCVALLEYTYVKAGNPYQPLYNLQTGMTIAQESVPTSVLVKPICPSVIIGSVEMNLQGPNTNWNIIQNVEPFALFDNFGTNVFGRTLEPGTYTLTVTGYSQDNKGGGVTYPSTITTFTITGTLAMINMPTYTGNEFCAGNRVAVNFTTSGTFGGGNQFKIQLSDKDGDFTNAIEIGTTATAGAVNCTIPLNTPYGENYRIRVASTNAVSQNMNPAAVTIHPYIANLVSPADDYSADKNRKAVYQLNATNKVNSPAKVNYQAGNAIILNAGFEAKAGTVFKAEIKTCPN